MFCSFLHINTLISHLLELLEASCSKTVTHPSVDMSRIFLHIICYVAVAASVSLWPVTNAYSLAPTMLPSSTFNPKGTPCEGVRCPSGRHCELNENYEASCVCDGNCYDYYNPLCGSDNRTYSSNCELTREACKTNRNISIIYYGQCQHEGSICVGITCPFNRVCAVAGGHATCVCSQNCPTYSNPVCGSDNRTYISDCDLRRHSCMTNVNITIAYYTECKQETACDQFSCPNGMQCAVDEHHNPVCVCAKTCPYSTDIVCGTDGRTYGSECELFKEACASANNIRVAYKGYCLEGSVCSGHRCPSNKQCNINQYNQPVCVCNQYCPYEYSPICGSDGVTYSNLCELKRQACITGTNITVARTGKCVYDEYCYGVTCPRPMYCVVDADNQTSCVCNDKCDGYYNPVCGSDNKTYDNYCQFNYVVCQTNISSAFYYGVCPEGPNCQGIYCGEGKHCDSEHQPEPKCVCNTDCPKTYNPICGSNNKTYNNTCELQQEACLTNTSITQQFNGKCDEGPGCRYTYCPFGTCAVDERNRPTCVCSQYCSGGSTEVCGSDNKTYSSDCFLRTAACMTNKTITLRQYGQCTTEASPCSGVVCPSDKYCEVGPRGRPICVCNEVCPSYGSPVCGSDNRTYSNYCQLRKRSCLSSSSILWLYYGRCVEASTCDRISCPPDKRCAVDDQNQPMCVCIDECLSVQSPVCGSDGLTYINDCELQKAACLSNRNTTLAHRGNCYQGLTCSDISCPTGRTCALDERNQPTCVCNTNCPDSYYYNPVCGTDGKIYSSECFLQRAACTTDTNIKVDYYGICKSDVSSSTTTTNRGCVGPSCTTTTTTITP